MRRRCTVDYCGIRWEVEGEYNKGRPAMFHLPNGDPGYPAEPSELFDVNICIKQDNATSDDLQNVLLVDAVQTLIDRALVILDEDDTGVEIPFDNR
jgi:hypothetical protein